MVVLLKLSDVCHNDNAIVPIDLIDAELESVFPLRSYANFRKDEETAASATALGIFQDVQRRHCRPDNQARGGGLRTVATL